MHLVVIHGWQQDDGETAKIIAASCGIIVFEARQKIAGGGPVVLTSFGDATIAKGLATTLTQAGVPALVIDSDVVRSSKQPFLVHRFTFGSASLQAESVSGECRDIEYSAIELLLVATGISGQTQSTSSVTERKFSLAKTMLSGGMPMTKKVTTQVSVREEERGEILSLYPREQRALCFVRAAMKYDGLGSAQQLTRDLNFNYLKTEVQRRAPQAIYDDRLLRRAPLVRLLGERLSPETDLDLAFEVLARSLSRDPS